MDKHIPTIIVHCQRSIWYAIIQHDVKITSVKDEITNFSKKYADRLSVHPNELAAIHLNADNDLRRLKRFKFLF